MKNAFIFTLVLLLTFSLVACSSKDSNSYDVSNDISDDSRISDVIPQEWENRFMAENLDDFIEFAKNGGIGTTHNDKSSAWKDCVSNQKFLNAIKDKESLPIIKSKDSDFKLYNIMLYPIAAYEFGLDKENDMRVFVKFLILEDNETDIELSELIKRKFVSLDFSKINFHEDTGVYGDYLYTNYEAGEESGQMISKVDAFFRYDDYLVEVFLGTYGERIENWDEKYFDLFKIEYADIK